MSVPFHIRCQIRVEKWWSATPIGQWVEKRNNSKLAQLKSFEIRCSTFLAKCANLPIAECFQQFNTLITGLNDSQVRDLVAKNGPNVLSSAKPRRWWNILLATLPNPFNLLLTVLAII